MADDLRERARIHPDPARRRPHEMGAGVDANVELAAIKAVLGAMNRAE